MGALIPLVISIAPEIAQWLVGGNAERTLAAIHQAIAAVTGTTDPASQQTKLENEAPAAARLRTHLLQIVATRNAEAHAASGRASPPPPPAAARSTVAWGAPVVSLVVLATFGLVMALALTKSMPVGSETLLTMLLGTLAAMATSVVSYWVGSSAGSARKDDRLAQIADTASGKP